MDRGAWWATVHGVAESDMSQWLSTDPEQVPKGHSGSENAVGGKLKVAYKQAFLALSVWDWNVLIGSDLNLFYPWIL